MSTPAQTPAKTPATATTAKKSVPTCSACNCPIKKYLPLVIILSLILIGGLGIKKFTKSNYALIGYVIVSTIGLVLASMKTLRKEKTD